MFTGSSREISIGNLRLGGNQPVRVQSMTNTSTMDTQATVNQVIRLVNAGCEMVRITASNIREAENLKNIKAALIQKGINVPLIADIHFQPGAAEVAAQIVHKVRINPGNYTGSYHHNKSYTEDEYKRELEATAKKLLPLIKICKTHHTAIRIGINHGSLSDRILFRYGNTAEGMVQSAMEFIEICRRAGFHDLVLSLKSSHVPTMIKANRLIVARMFYAGYDYPLHLGVTEAGNGEEARIKAAAGIGSLLAAGIGDTVRVSLTEAPENEIPVARRLIEFYGRGKKTGPQVKVDFYSMRKNKSIGFPLVITSPKAKNADADSTLLNIEKEDDTLNNKDKIIRLSYSGIPYEELLLRASADFTRYTLHEKPAGIWIENNNHTSAEDLAALSLKILQALGLRYTKTEFIACPSCGRTQFDIEKVLEEVKSKLDDLKGLKIAVMGCIVNGPGEMTVADFGLVGSGAGKVNLYKRKQIIQKNVDIATAGDELLKLIRTIDLTNP